MIKKDTYTKEEVIEMLKEMQMETYKCVGFVVGMVTQSQVIKNMLGKRIVQLSDGTSEAEVSSISESIDRMEDRKYD